MGCLVGEKKTLDVTAVDGFQWGCAVEPGTHPAPVPLFRVHVPIPIQSQPRFLFKSVRTTHPRRLHFLHAYHKCWVPAAQVCGSACLTVGKLSPLGAPRLLASALKERGGGEQWRLRMGEGRRRARTRGRRSGRAGSGPCPSS